MYLNNKQYYSNKKSAAFTSWQCHAVEHFFPLNQKKNTNPTNITIETSSLLIVSCRVRHKEFPQYISISYENQFS